MLYCFINDAYCYCSEIDVKGSGYGFGFIVPEKGTVQLDNLYIAIRSASGVSSKIKQNQAVEFEYTTIESLNQNIINK